MLISDMVRVNSILWLMPWRDLNISTEHLSAHNALHDAVFTAHICQKLDIQQGILHYDLIRKESSNPFFISTNFNVLYV